MKNNLSKDINASNATINANNDFDTIIPTNTIYREKPKANKINIDEINLDDGSIEIKEKPLTDSTDSIQTNNSSNSSNSSRWFVVFLIFGELLQTGGVSGRRPLTSVFKR